MSTTAKATKNSVLSERTSLAQVNLLPPEIGESRQFQRVKRYMVYVLLGFIGVLGIVYFLATGVVGAAEDRLTDAQDEEIRLRSERAKYSEVLVVENHLNLAIAAESHGMLYEVDWRAYLDGIGAVTPESISYLVIEYSGASAMQDLLDPSNQMYEEKIGALEIMGNTSDQGEFGNWIRAINALPGLDGTWVLSSEPSATEDGDIFWTFTGEILVGEEALSHRVVDSPAAEQAEETPDSESESEEEEG